MLLMAARTDAQRVFEPLPELERLERTDFQMALQPEASDMRRPVLSNLLVTRSLAGVQQPVRKPSVLQASRGFSRLLQRGSR